MGSLTGTIDEKRYARLLAKAAPRVIRTEEENERALAIVESLMERGERHMCVPVMATGAPRLAAQVGPAVQLPKENTAPAE